MAQFISLQFYQPKIVLLYGFLISSFYVVMTNNQDVLKAMGSTGRSFYMDSSMHDRSGCDDKALSGTSDKDAIRQFRDKLKLEKLIGNGDVSYGFGVKYQNKEMIAKVATDKDLFYSDIEIGIFEELNKPPSIPNIPQLQLAIRSMPNPFADNDANTTNPISYLVGLGVDKKNAKKLVMKRRISVMVMEVLKGRRKPEDLEEVQRMMKSMLETMEFVHSRNIMHCDLHDGNYFWDGDKVYMFDWNGGFRYKPGKVKIHYPRTPKHLFPPEAKDDESAVHTSVYAFDMYSIGRIMKIKLKDCCGITFQNIQNTALEVETRKKSRDATTLNGALAYELAAHMMHSDPYQRPNATEALQHVFFQRTIPKKKNRNTHR